VLDVTFPVSVILNVVAVLELAVNVGVAEKVVVTALAGEPLTAGSVANVIEEPDEVITIPDPAVGGKL
jgi:hypothetical protein